MNFQEFMLHTYKESDRVELNALELKQLIERYEDTKVTNTALCMEMEELRKNTVAEDELLILQNQVRLKEQEIEGLKQIVGILKDKNTSLELNKPHYVSLGSLIDKEA
jgi:hypothetical protein